MTVQQMTAVKKMSRLLPPLTFRLALLFCIGVCLSPTVRSQQYPAKTGPVYDEAINYLSSTHGGGLTTGATIPLTYTSAGEKTPLKITNIVSLKLNEEATTYIPDNFQASVTVQVDYGASPSATTSVTQILTISYSKDGGVSYNPKQYLSFTGAQYVQVTITNVPANSLSNGVSVISLLSVCNEMHIWRDYILSPSGSVTPTLQVNTPATTGVPDELPVQWSLPAGYTGHNGLQLEWAWLETELASLYTQNGSINYDLLFRNNSTRVSLPLGTTGYNIPLYYDGTGNLYCRVRLVNIQYNGTVSDGPWSTVQSYAFGGHNNDLNWQVTTSYAEDGKRKVVMAYFDGSLRQRQTVTKDNSTNTTVSAETFYDGQGRPAIQILPAPGISSIVAYNQTLNLFNGQTPGSDPGVFFDLGSGSSTMSMDNGYGAALYYSAGNTEIAQGSNQNIPDAGGFPYTVTQYTPDATGRIMAQSGVGQALKMGSNHETKYFYGTAAQEELDGLFGTDAGDFTHYFKNMVRDGNGQSTVSYVDMHGRT
ncbi:MAG TPA: DUF6443 domain-containing protein, partial [Puia sp.]|nr:DUF6443 domain-containing protein [Puia sp.]